MITGHEKKGENENMNDENMKEPVPVQDADVGTAADVEAVMKKYDRESNVRIWEGIPLLIIRWLSVGFSIYCIYVTLFSTALPEVRLTTFLGMILILGYLNYPIKKGVTRVNYMPWYDVVIMVAGSAPFFYFALHAQQIIKLATRVTRDPMMVVIAIIAVVALMELCCRCLGISILCAVVALLVYYFSTLRFGEVIYDLFYTTSSLMNTLINLFL